MTNFVFKHFPTPQSSWFCQQYLADLLTQISLAIYIQNTRPDSNAVCKCQSIFHADHSQIVLPSWHWHNLTLEIMTKYCYQWIIKFMPHNLATTPPLMPMCNQQLLRTQSGIHTHWILNRHQHHSVFLIFKWPFSHHPHTHFWVKKRFSFLTSHHSYSYTCLSALSTE